MNFNQPLWLYAILPALLVCGVLWVYASRSRKKRIGEWIAPKRTKELLQSVSSFKRGLKAILILGALICLLLALARPQWGYHWEEHKSKGIDVLIALDVSRSMLAEDIRPNRIDRAKLSIIDLLDTMGSDRVGLIAFAGSAFLQCPLTLDYDAFELTLDTVQPGIIPVPGTDIAAAINEANAAFDAKTNQRVLILITDGEDHSGEGLKRAQDVSKDGVIIYTVGVGTAEGAKIPIRDQHNRTDFVRDRLGNIVTTRLEPDTLQDIATRTGGFYSDLNQDPRALTAIYQDILKRIPAQERDASLKRIGIERFQWFLAACVLLLMIEPLIGTRRRVRPQTKALAPFIILALLPALPNDLHASSDALQSAQNAYAQGDYAQASEHYREALKSSPNNADLLYNLGTSLYREGQLDEAQKTFTQAINHGTPALQSKAFYNQGNLLFHQGKKQLEQSPQQTVTLWEKALEQYQNALEINADDLQAQENHDTVSQMLEALKKSLEEQEQEKQQEDQPEDPQSSPSEQEQNQDESKSQNSQGGQDSQSSSGGSDGQEGESESESESSPDPSDDQQDGKGDQDESSQEQGDESPPSEGSENKDSKDESGASEQDSPASDQGETPQEPSESEQKDSEENGSAENNSAASEDSDMQEKADDGSTSSDRPEPKDSEQGDSQEESPSSENLSGEDTEGASANRQDTEPTENEADEKAVRERLEEGEALSPEEGKEKTKPSGGRVIPGVMSTEEARILLESIRRNERNLPFRGQGTPPSSSSRNQQKDW